jgi:hypothetical protein
MQLVATFTCENREANLNLRQFGLLSRTVQCFVVPAGTPFWYDLTLQGHETWVICRKMRLKCRCCASRLPSTKTSFAPAFMAFPNMWLKVGGLNTFPVSYWRYPTLLKIAKSDSTPLLNADSGTGDGSGN